MINIHKELQYKEKQVSNKKAYQTNQRNTKKYNTQSIKKGINASKPMKTT